MLRNLILTSSLSSNGTEVAIKVLFARWDPTIAVCAVTGKGAKKKSILLWHWIPHHFQSFSALNIVRLKSVFALKIPPKWVIEIVTLILYHPPTLQVCHYF